MKNFLPAVLAVLLMGGVLGSGFMTFYYAEGASYFSTDPAACVNCHIMRPQYESWLKSSHKNVATCADCHLPHDVVGKYLAKAENGYHHSKAFTLQNFHEPIMIKEKNSRILQESCLHCHKALVHDMAAGPSAGRAPGAFSCVHCHADVGHGEPLGLGGMEDYPGRKGLNTLKRKLAAEQNP